MRSLGYIRNAEWATLVMTQVEEFNYASYIKFGFEDFKIIKKRR